MASPGRALAVVAAIVATAIPAATASAAAPANDNFSDAATLAPPGASETTVSGTTTEATGEAGEPDPAGAGLADGCTAPQDSDSNSDPCQRSVWYTMTPTEDGPVALQTCELSAGGDTVLGVYTGDTLGALTEVVSNDEGKLDGGCGDSFVSRVNFIAHAGTTYRIVVAGWHANETDFTVHATRTLDPPQLYSEFFGGSVNPDLQDQAFDIASAAGATLTCTLDGGAPAPCASRFTYAPDRFAEGSSHTLTASATGGGTSADSQPVTWTIDRSAPAVAFSGDPTDPADGSTSAMPLTFHLTTDEGGTPVCLVGGVDVGLQGCSFSNHVDATSSGQSFPISADYLCDGPHTFGFAVMDAAGNYDATPPTRTVTTTNGTGPCELPTLSGVSVAPGGPNYADYSYGIDSHASPTSFHVEWGLTNSYGNRTEEDVLGVGSGGGGGLGPDFLDPGTHYHFRLVAKNEVGTVYSDDMEFTTPAADGPAPSVTLGEPTNITSSAATLNASGGDAEVKFEYGTTTAYGQSTRGGPSARVHSLQPDTTYHYRALATSPGGTTHTADATFRTAAEPGSSPEPESGSGSEPGSADVVPGGGAPVTPTQPLPLPLPVDHTSPLLKGTNNETVRLTPTGKLSFNIYSGELADGTATGTISLPGGARVLRFPKRAVHLTGGARTKITLRLSKKNAKRVRAALAHRRKLKAKITVSVHDAAGNKTTKKLTLKLKR